MNLNEVLKAYGSRATELTNMLGTEISEHDQERFIVEGWARNAQGPLLDVGSGTGRWAGHLSKLGHKVEGIEPVAEFVEIASNAHPEVTFRVASIADLNNSDDKWAGVLAWYSLIHLDPTELPKALLTLRNVITDGGSMLMSFFAGPHMTSFNHPVTLAYSWPVEEMVQLLESASFKVVGQWIDPPLPHAIIFAEAV